MGRLTQHRAQFGGPPLGDVAMPVTGSGLVGTRHEAGIAGDVLGAREAAHIGEHRQRGEGNHRSDPGHRLEAAHLVAHRPTKIR
jgi:hypothetical protein